MKFYRWNYRDSVIIFPAENIDGARKMAKDSKIKEINPVLYEEIVDRWPDAIYEDYIWIDIK